MKSLRWRLLWVVVPTVLAGCFGRGRGPKPARAPSRSDSAAAAATPTSTPTAARDSTAPDSAAKAGRDTIAARDSAKLAVAKKDSLAKKGAKKAATPAKQCVLDFSESPPETRLRYQRLQDSSGLTFIGGGFVGHCQGDKNEIKADSAEHYESSGVLNLFGNVSYIEPKRMRVEAQHATYFTKEERLFADGNVVATQLSSGSTFRGKSIEYLRPLAGSRPSSRLIAPNRPTLQMFEKDSTGKPGPPVTVVANTMVDEADTLLFAWGDVQIDRAALHGESDSASFDKITERARLIRGASIANREKDKPFRLFGDTVDIFSKDRKVERVVALHNGNASSNDVVMQAERIDLRFTDQELDRAYASGKGRAKATTASQLLVADSLVIRMPDQKVREVRAIGSAVATGTPDTLQIKSDDRDLLRGDTITAWFDSTQVAGDTTQRTEMKEVHAVGSASSLFQIASKQGPTFPASLNYVRGKIIHVLFDSGQVRLVTVDSAATGLYQEPAVDSLSDSTKAKPGAAARRKVPPTPSSPRPPAELPLSSPLDIPDVRRRS